MAELLKVHSEQMREPSEGSFRPPERVRTDEVHTSDPACSKESTGDDATGACEPEMDSAEPSAPVGKPPIFPVQVNFYFWLDDFLHLCAEGQYSEAKDSLDHLREHPQSVKKPRWDMDSNSTDDTGGTTVSNSGTESGSEPDDEEHNERVRRCLAAYASAVSVYMRQIQKTAAAQLPNEDSDEGTWEIQTVPHRGRTVVATRRIAVGEEIITERPIALLQYEASSRYCPECLRAITSDSSSFEAVREATDAAGLGQNEAQPHSTNDSAEGTAQKLEIVTESTASTSVTEGCNASASLEGQVPGSIDNVALTAGMENWCTCGVVFCSASCKERALRGHHSLLCRSLLAPEQLEAYNAIDALAERIGNRSLLLAVHLTAEILAVVGSLSVADQQSGLSEIFERHVGNFHSAPWESLIQDEKVCAERVKLVEELAGYTRQLLQPFCDRLHDTKAVFELLLAPAALSCCIGMLELVCVKASVLKPLLLQEGDPVSIDDASTECPPCDDSYRFSAKRGADKLIFASAMVNFVSFCNHSCIPNIEVDFRHEDERPGLWCVVTATRTIAAGEELNMQYMPVVATPFTKRQETLQDHWHFKCECVRCSAEEIFSEEDAKWFSAGWKAFRPDDDSVTDDTGSVSDVHEDAAGAER